MKYLKIETIIFFTLFFISTLKCQTINYDGNKIDSLNYTIKYQRIFFVTEDGVFPFNLIVRNFSDWDSFSIFYDHTPFNSKWIVIPGAEELNGKKVNVEYIYDTTFIDSLRSYFSDKYNLNSCNITNDSLINKAKREIKYSYLLNSLNLGKLYNYNNELIRLVKPTDYKREKFDIITINSCGDSLLLNYLLIKTKNLQEYSIINRDSVYLSLKDIDKLNKLLNENDFSKLKSDFSSDEFYCKDSEEFLLEFYLNNKYSHFFICPYKKAISKIEKSELKRLLKISKLINYLRYKYIK